MPSTSPVAKVDLILFKAPPKGICNWMFQSHTCNFCTALTVSGLKTKVIYSFSDKRFNLTEACKIQACVHLCLAWCPLMLCAALCVVHLGRVMLSSYAVMQFLVQAGSTPIALSVCRERALSVGCVCPAPSEPLGLFLAGHPSDTGCFELVHSEAERLYSSILYCTWLWATTGSCMLLLWPQGMNFSLSFKCGVFETTYMLDVLIAWTQGLYLKFHEYIFIEWKACWEVLNRLGRTEGVTLTTFLLPILVFGNSFWSEVFPELCLVFVFRETVQSNAGGCSQVFHV